MSDGRLVNGRMKWVGYVERMNEDRLPRVVYYIYQEKAG